MDENVTEHEKLFCLLPPSWQRSFPTIPVTNVVPATLNLVEVLHGPHVLRAPWEGQAWQGWLVCVVNVEERDG